MIKWVLVIFCVFIAQLGATQSPEQQTDSLLAIIQQTSSDSIKAEHYFSLALLNLYSEPLLSVAFSQEAIAIGKKIEDHIMVSNAYVQMFNAHFYYGSPAQTLLKNIKELEDHVRAKLTEEEMLRVYWIYALYYNNIGQTDKEIAAYIKALAIARAHATNANLAAGLLGNIGDILLQQGKYIESLAYFEEALRITDDDIGKGVLLQNIGMVYNYEEKYDSALTFFEQAYDYNQKGQDIGGMARALIEKGRYYDRKKELERAKQHYFQALELIESNNIGSLLPSIFVAIAEFYQRNEDYGAAINYGEASLKEIKKQQNYTDLSATYHILHQGYAAVGNYQRAYEIRDEQFIYRDSVSNAELLTKVEALKTAFEVEQKETENDLLKAEAATHQQTIQNKNITALALLLGLLLLGSWAIVVFRSNRRKQRYNEQLEVTVAERTAKLEKANKDLAQANYELQTFNYIASHDIKEPIRNIGSYAGLVFRKLSPGLQSNFKEYFDNIKKSTAQLYTLVEDFSRYTQLSKDHDIEIQWVDLNTLLENLELSLASSIEEKNARIINEGLVRIQTNSSLIYIILKNIIENGLKFNQSETPTVRLSAVDHESYTNIFIADNGIGIEPIYQKQVFDVFKRLHSRQDFKGSGIGLAIVKLLIDKLGASVSIESNSKQGSTFIVQLPKP